MNQYRQSEPNERYEQPDIPGQPSGVNLLAERHWSYIQRRYSISPRELQVARLVCRGLNNEQIARDLNIKSGTVKTHIRNIYRRICVKNKIQMLLRFIDAVSKASENPHYVQRFDVNRPE